MVNMLPSVAIPFLPMVWVLVASAYWWRKFSAPWLFAVAALFALFGIQSVVSFLWDFWPFSETHALVNVAKVSEADMQQYLEEKNRIAMIQGVLVLIAGVPFLWWLKGGLSRAQRP
jgi:hypothetical protein